MLQNFSQTQGTVFHSLACISSSEGFFKNRSAHFCDKSPSSGACPSQIAILFSLGLKFLKKWKPTYIYGDLNFSDSQQVFANLFSWRKLEGSLIISWKFQGRTPQEIWITSIFPRAEQSGQLWCLAPYGPQSDKLRRSGASGGLTRWFSLASLHFIGYFDRMWGQINIFSCFWWLKTGKLPPLVRKILVAGRVTQVVA